MKRLAPMLWGVLIAGLLTAPGPSAGVAATETGPASANPAPTNVATRKAATTRKPVTQAVLKARPRKAQSKAVSDSTVVAPAPTRSKSTEAPSRPSEGKTPSPRTLDEISIQGEIPVPQVLFITARDQRRFLDFHHRRYLQTSQRIGETTVFPSWISVANGVEPPVQEPPR